MRRGNIRGLVPFVILFLLALFVWYPMCMLVTGAVLSDSELEARLAPVLSEEEGVAQWPLFTTRLTLSHIVELLLDTPEFFRVFWNSCVQVFPSVLLQIAVGAPAAWGLSQYSFRGRRALLYIYIALMILPFQVTMASHYFVLDALSLIDTPFAIILPAAFSAFPVFIMTKFFAKIPKSLVEAARIDGANEFTVFLLVGLRMGAPGVLSAALMGFIECYNAVEQPITFLKSETLTPLSVFLPQATLDNAGVSFVSALITLIPALLLFLWGQKYLEQGIVASGLKE